MKRSSLSLMIKVMLIILISVGVSLTAMGWVNYRSAEEIILQTLEDNANSQVVIHATQLGTWLNTRIKEVEVVANTDTVRSGTHSTIMTYLQHEKERSKGIYSSFSMGDTKGNLTLDNGMVIQIGDEPTFPQVMQGKSVISNPFPDKQDPQSLIVSFEAAIFDSSQKVKGLISGASTINKIFAENAQFKVGKTDQVSIFQGDGTYIYHPDASKILKENIFKTDETLANEIMKKQAGSLRMDKSGDDHLYFFSKIPETDWMMVLDVPAKEFMAPLGGLLKWIIISGVVTLVLIAFLIFVILRGPFKKIHEIAFIAEKVSEGDLDVQELKIQSRDEVGQLAFAINTMVENLRNLLGHLIGQVRDSAEQVSQLSHLLLNRANETKHASHEMASSMAEMAGGAESQMLGATDSHHAMEEMAIGISRIAASSSEVASSSSYAFEQARKGDETITHIADQMEHIMKVSDHSSKLVTDLGERSKEIGQIITVITGLSDQTNLLALNAAIEAARAGEHGRGFAIVADEVRKLAEQSRRSAEQIRGLITEIQSHTSQAMHAMDEGYDEVKKGIESVKDARNLFGQIVQSVNKVNEQIQDISATSEEMSAATEEVTASVEQLSFIAKETLASSRQLSVTTTGQIQSMDELAESARSLAQMSEELHGLIAKFKISRS